MPLASTVRRLPVLVALLFALPAFADPAAGPAKQKAVAKLTLSGTAEVGSGHYLPDAGKNAGYKQVLQDYVFNRLKLQAEQNTHGPNKLGDRVVVRLKKVDIGQTNDDHSHNVTVTVKAKYYNDAE
jgi:hypothetical protein